MYEYLAQRLVFVEGGTILSWIHQSRRPIHVDDAQMTNEDVNRSFPTTHFRLLLLLLLFAVFPHPYIFLLSTSITITTIQ